MKSLSKTKDVRILQETPFFQDRVSNWKMKKHLRRNILGSSYMKFHPIRSRGYGEISLDGWTACRQANEVATIYAPFVEHKE